MTKSAAADLHVFKTKQESLATKRSIQINSECLDKKSEIAKLNN